MITRKIKLTLLKVKIILNKFLIKIGNLKIHENPKVPGNLDLSSQNKNIYILDIYIEEFKISTHFTEDGQEKINKTWIHQFHSNTHFAGKLTLDNIIIDSNTKGMDFDYLILPKENYRGNIGNLKDFMNREYNLNKNVIQEVHESDRQLYYMTNEKFYPNESCDNFYDGDIRVEVVCVRKIYTNFIYFFLNFFSVI